MKKWIGIFIGILLHLTLYSQERIFSGEVWDAIGYFPIHYAHVHNFTKDVYTFTNSEGKFRITVSLYDTLIISGPIYRQLVVVIEEDLFQKCTENFYLYHKAFLLNEVKIVALNPSYEGFKRDVATMKLPDSYKNLQSVHLNKTDRQNATYSQDPNFLNGTALGHPITYLYNTFSKKMKMKALAQEMTNYGDEVGKVQEKYNRHLVNEITGLEGTDLMEFMIFCRFSYYDLVRWSQKEIIDIIRYKYTEYQYYKALQIDD